MLLDDASVVQMDRPVGVRRIARVVGHHADGRAIAVQLTQQLHHEFAVVRVEVARRLVGQQDGWLGHHRTGHCHALLLTARQLARQVPRPVSHADPLEGLVDALAALGLGHPHVREGELHVLVHTQVADQVEALEDEPDLAVPRARALDDRQALDRPVVEPVLALRGCVEQAEDRQERRLAATRGAFDRDVLTEVDREVDAVESVGHDFVALENLADAFQTDQRVCHRVLFPLRLYLICSRSTWSQADMSERITRSPCCNPSTT